MSKQRNKNIELLDCGRPDRGLNYNLLLESFNEKPMSEQVEFVNEVCHFLDLISLDKDNAKILKISELIFTFLELPYTYNKSTAQIEVEAISKNNKDISKCDTYYIDLDNETLIQKFGSSVKNEELEEKLFNAIHNCIVKEGLKCKI